MTTPPGRVVFTDQGGGKFGASALVSREALNRWLHGDWGQPT